jgi:hypothetical protein
MGHTAAVTPLAELLKVFGCADIIAPVETVAFGRRAGELMTRVAFGKTAHALLTRVVSDRQHPRRYVPKIDRVPIGGSPRVRMPSDMRGKSAGCEPSGWLARRGDQNTRGVSIVARANKKAAR